MQLRTTHRDVAGQLVLALDGAADLASLPQLHDTLQRLLGSVESGMSVAIDLDGVTLLEDAALGLLLGAAATARSRGAAVTVVCTAERLRQRLADTRFDRAVDVVASLGEAVVDRWPELS